MSFQLQAQTSATKYDSVATYYHPDSPPESQSYFGYTLAHTKGWYIATKAKNKTNTELDVVFMKEDSISGLIARTEIQIIDSLAPVAMTLNSTAADSFYFLYFTFNYKDQSGSNWQVPRLEVFKLDQNDDWKPHQSITLKTLRETGIINLAADNRHLIVGASQESQWDSSNNQLISAGTAYVYELNSEHKWAFAQTLKRPRKQAYDRFGYAVSVYKDLLAVSAPHHGLTNSEGIVYLYKLNEQDEWHYSDSFKTENQSQIQFGWNVLICKAGLFITSRDGPSYYHQRINYKAPLDSEFRHIEYTSYAIKYGRASGLYYHNQKIYSSLEYGYYTTITNDEEEQYERCVATIHSISNDTLKFESAILTHVFASLGPKIAISGNKVMANLLNAHKTDQDSQRYFNVGSLVLFGEQSCTASIDSLNLSACDNYTPPSLNKEWNVSGQYKDTFINENHCITYLDVDLDMKYSTFQSIDTTVCGNFMVPSKKRVIQNAGSYWDTISNSVGCDSVIFIYLKSLNTDASIELINGVLIANKFHYPFYFWVNCITGDTIPNENSHRFRPTEPGLYALTVSDGRCSNTSACLYVSEDDILPSFMPSEILVFPNPSLGMITLDFNKVQEDIEVEIYNAQGQKVNSVSLRDLRKHEIELPHESGLYFLRIKATDFEQTVVKVVRE
ncbi:T9SS type A sorting domain-containing protein [bacterium]|nr:T9SS type A sorting domain-containing protein [bacterium]